MGWWAPSGAQNFSDDPREWPPNSCPTQACTSDCPTGQYRSGCGGTSPGACVGCTNTISDDQYYSGHGGLTNNCPTASCNTLALTCAVGEYRAGCGKFGSPTDYTQTGHCAVRAAAHTRTCMRADPTARLALTAASGLSPVV